MEARLETARPVILVDLERRRQEAIRRSFLRLDAIAFGAGVGVLCGICLFLATAWLVVKGSSDGVGSPGPTLNEIRPYLPGFSVTWPGAFIGALEFSAVGYVCGWLCAATRNAALRFVLWKAVADQRRFRRRHLLDEI